MLVYVQIRNYRKQRYIHVVLRRSISIKMPTFSVLSKVNHLYLQHQQQETMDQEIQPQIPVFHLLSVLENHDKIKPSLCQSKNLEHLDLTLTF